MTPKIAHQPMIRDASGPQLNVVLPASVQSSGTLLSRQQLAKRLQVCKHTVQRWEKRSFLKAIHFNSRVVRYRLEDVERLIRDATK